MGERGVWRKSSYSYIEQTIKNARRLMVEDRDNIITTNKPRRYRLTRSINQCDRALSFIKRDEGSAP